MHINIISRGICARITSDSKQQVKMIMWNDQGMMVRKKYPIY